MAYLTRDQILQADDIQTRDVDVPEWGGAVRVRGMTGTQRDAFETSLANTPKRGKRETQKNRQFRARMCAWCIVDESGQQMFTERDITALGAKSGAALDRVFEVARELSYVTEEDVDALAEEMLEDPFDDSPTD